MDEQRLPELVRALYRIVGELEVMFPGRHFTPDGHLVGSLGECLAAYHYGLELLPASEPSHDARCGDRLIQIKATQGKSVALRANAEHLLVIKLDREGGFEEIYNGPGGPVWDSVKDKPVPSNGQRQVSISKLRSLHRAVHPGTALPLVRRSQMPPQGVTT